MSHSVAGKKLAVVLGMHRSGTSAVSRGLQVMGVELGDRLMPPNPEVNAKGFWEDIDLNALNIEMLHTINSDWHYLSPITQNDVETLQKRGYFLRAVALLRQKIGNAPVFGFKDPRVAKLLPFWVQVFNHCRLEAFYVLTLRHPLSVARSLQKRDRLDAVKSYVLWLDHVVTSLIGTAGSKRIIVDYDLLMQSAEHELGRVARCFGLAIDMAALQSYKAEFLDEGLRHTVYGMSDLLSDKACPPLVREVYETMLGAAAGSVGDDASLQSKVESWAREFERFVPILGLVDGLTRQNETVGHDLAECQEQLDGFDGILGERDGQINALTRVLGERDEQNNTLTRVVAERDGQVASLARALTEREGQIVGLTQDVINGDGQIASLAQEVAKHEGQVASLARALAERDVQVASLTREVVRGDGQIASLTQELAEREGQVANLVRVTTENEEKVVSLTRMMAERERKIASLTRVVGKRDMRIADLSRELTEYDVQVASAQAVIEYDEQISELMDEIVRRGDWALVLKEELAQVREQLAQVQEQLAALVGSRSWRATLPLRLVAGAGRQSIRHSGGLAFKLMRKTYHLLPVSTLERQRVKGWFYQRFPSVFSHTLSYSMWKAQPAGTMTEQVEVMQPQVGEPFELPGSENPVVSIVIPVYGKIDYTYHCLRSLWLHRSHYSFEVIVVDDCSPDNTLEVLETIKGVRVVRNETNSGFIRSCNMGASVAKGAYVHFLNNDTQVTAGWLDELVRTFDEFPGTGLAGSKLVYPNGTLQEAGGIVWRDGSAWNFGRNQDPLLPIYSYAREVDYCSGASIMMPKKLFDELGGFDEHYHPAYCEDVDIALKARNLGYRVIYQPLSIVVHFEGVTSGTDTDRGVKAYQVENTKKLYARWHAQLKQHQVHGTDIDDAKDRRASRRVLVIDHCTPTPNQDSGSIDTYNLLLLLREMDFQPTFMPEDNFLWMDGYTAALQRVGVESLYAPYVTSVEQHLKIHGDRYDLVILIRPKVAENHMSAVRKFCPKAKVLFHTVDLHFLRMKREAELSSNQQQEKAAETMKSMELSLMRSADMATVISVTELELITPEIPEHKIRLLPYSRSIHGTKEVFATRRDFVFVGGYQHTPNVDAVKYFAAEIMPIIRSRLPGVRFHIVGSKTPPEVLALAASDVIVHGFVEDINSLLNQMRVSVVPLRFGAGIKGKIGTAMAVGLPVVSTRIGAEGMLLTDGVHILVADGARDFAEAAVRLYGDELLWSSISEASIKFADSAWGAEASWNILSGILADMGFDTKRDGRPLTLYSA